MIPFNMPPATGVEDKYIKQALKSKKLCGDGPFGKQCQEWFENKLPAKKTLLTPSCTAALELAAILLDIQPGDEVIMPSYTFVSTSNAFVLRGAQVVFVDIRPDTMNIDENLIEAAVTPRTRAIVPVHYAGVACEMDSIMNIAARHNLYVIEDAAQAMMSSYKGQALGTIGHLGAFSFHETKNYTSGGEGGLLIINDERFAERAEVIREKGTNRSQFFRGMVDKYQWVDIGSSYLPSELQAAYLWGQIEMVAEINDHRRGLWQNYNRRLMDLAVNGKIELPTIPPKCKHNAHMFYIKVRNLDEQTAFIEFMAENNIGATFHYVPLHSSLAGIQFGRFNGTDNFTSKESQRLVRLPMFYGMKESEIEKVVTKVLEYFS